MQSQKLIDPTGRGLYLCDERHAHDSSLKNINIQLELAIYTFVITYNIFPSRLKSQSLEL